jgi:hypothetical protein
MPNKSRAEYLREWRSKNREKCRLWQINWRSEHPEKMEQYSKSNKERCRRWYEKNAEKQREYSRKWRINNPEKAREIDRNKTRHYYPDKFNARKAVFMAIKNGRIDRPTHCSRCGKECKPQGHHHRGYEFALDVIWLCSVCHGIEHRKI